ncbi:ABC transporter ATP-binding protein [Gordonibacter sp. 28C]|uniref:ABC transporter ATP-binding protein n=1 Tax=Gordonibacter sp. 28C TaxID=2078569 RepID=UPI000DF834C4|nr:ABC transporter ATP-binding protein [Gordonibacter sp. 28C]RDB63096.1 ABC transporter ATP-binding protein [Gordonibacter sp. 28C]
MGDGEARGRATALRVENLAYRYGRTEVFAGASFALRAGEVAFLTGPNGAGKSTLLRCLAGWDAPSEGRVELCCERFDGSNRSQRSRVAFVPDVPSFYDDLTAGEHLRFVRQANRLGAADDPSELLMERFGLGGQRDLLPSSYSRGMRQKLALVLAFARLPRLMLLDEPYGPLDPGASGVLSELVEEARADGVAVLASCHHDVPNLAPDLLLHLEGGRLDVRGGGDGGVDA